MTNNLFEAARPESRGPNKGRKARAWFMSGLLLVTVVFPWLLGFYTDYLWFKEVDYTQVFTTTLLVRLAMFAVFGLLGAAAVCATLMLAFKYRPDALDVLDPSSPVHAYRAMMEKVLKPFIGFISLIAFVVVGMIGLMNWPVVMLFLNRQAFGVTDPQFGLDYGVYAFALPMGTLIVSVGSLVLGACFVLALVGHYLLGGIRTANPVTGEKMFVSNAARLQLAVIAGLWMLLQVVSYFFDRFDLLFKDHGTFTGGNYTDINAVLPAKMVLMVIAFVVAIAFFSAVFLKDFRIPAIATILMVISAGVIGIAWPLAIERFSVAPNRAEKESEYISRNIEATRFAYGITDEQVTYEENWGAEGATDEAVAADAATLSNIRILDPDVLSKTFTQQQQLKNFYGFPDTLNIDRYVVEGKLQDYVVAAREIKPSELQQNQRDWINRHTVYTHGNGFIAAPANRVDEVARDVGSARGGYPVYAVADLQTMEGNSQGADAAETAKLDFDLTQPRIYYGPVIASGPAQQDYAVVKTAGNNPVEYDTDRSNFTYDGSGGVNIGSFFNRAVFAAKYQELNLLLSDRIGPESKLIFNRDPRSRVEQVAPWLTTDSATYPAVVDGRIKWIVDGYTTLAALPYAQRTSLTEATEDSLNPDGTRQRLFLDEVGYIRNSVKAVVDAYDGTVDLYAFDESDPVLKAWQGVFPGTVKPKSEISDELMAHLRYPEDLFKVQREMLARYHVDDPGTFFTNDAFWSVPKDPSSSADGNAESARNQPAYYIVAADPKDGQPSFQLITPFRGLNREFLAAHMTVSSDPDTYGRITVRVLPTNTQTMGPKQVQDTMMSSDEISRDRSLWKATNKLTNGNLLTLPVGGGEILYVEPLYSQREGQESAFPKLLRVLVSYKGKVGYAPTIAEALAQVGIDPRSANAMSENPDDAASVATQEDKAAPAADNTPAPAAGDEASAIAAINSALAGLDAAKNKSHEEYGRALDELDRAVRSYQDLVNR